MIVKIFRREALPDDGGAFAKVAYVYQVVDRPEFVVCSNFVEGFLGIERRGLRDVIAISVLPPASRDHLRSYSTDEMLAEIDRRLSEKR